MKTVSISFALAILILISIILNEVKNAELCFKT